MPSINVDFVTLGMFIIASKDDIYPSPNDPNQTPRHNIIGGAGTYSAIGARLLSPPPQLSPRVAWIVDAGTDFPDSIRSTLLSWHTNLLLRPRDALTTRGWNGYTSDDHRAFKYLTAKLRLTADDLTEEFLGSRSFHFICGAKRCVEMVKRILDRRREIWGGDALLPLVIWEPVPDYCVPAELEETLQALAWVDVISPNHEELAGLFGYESPSGEVDAVVVERFSRRLLERKIGLSTRGAVVVRASKRGCCVVTHDGVTWLPAYHQDARRVVDPTGGGNGFLGGFAVGMVRTGNDLVEAARWGSVAASFCIEQVGMPVLQDNGSLSRETWNGECVQDRLVELRKRG